MTLPPADLGCFQEALEEAQSVERRSLGDENPGQSDAIELA